MSDSRHYAGCRENLGFTHSCALIWSRGMSSKFGITPVNSVILAICCVSFSGCGTLSDRWNPPLTDDVFYRGVQFDVDAVKEGGPKILMAADIPFSAVADTLLAPFDAYWELIMPRWLSNQMYREGKVTHVPIFSSHETPPSQSAN